MHDIDAVREYWDHRPCNVRHSTQPIGTREYFNEVEERRYFVEPHILSFSEFDKWRGKKVLEIGCGIGTDMINFARHGAHVTVVDLSRNSIGLARKRAAVFDLQDRIQFYVADAESLRAIVPIEPYDLIYSVGAIHHTPHPDRALNEMRYYTKSGTTVKLILYNRHSWKTLWILAVHGKGRFWRLSELIAQHSEAEPHCPVTYAYSKRDVRRLVKLCGWCLVTLQSRHIFPWRIPDYRQHRYVKVWYFRWLPRVILTWLERRFGWHWCVTLRVDERM